MNIFLILRRVRLAGPWFLCLLVACATVACSTSQAPRLFVMSPIPVAAAVPAAVSRDLSVFVREVQIPQYLERSQIVLRGTDHRIQLVDDAHWAGNLQQDLVRVLTENLGVLLGSDRVSSTSRSGALKPDFRVDGALLDSQTVRLSGAFVPDRSYDALVAAMSAVFGDLARAMSASIIRQSSTPS
jgi:uncharacterized lipoprotein YmbA